MRKKNIDIFNNLAKDIQSEIIGLMNDYLEKDNISLNELAVKCNELSGMKSNRISLRKLMNELGVDSKNNEQIIEARRIKTVKNNVATRNKNHKEAELTLLRQHNKDDLIKLYNSKPRKSLAKELGVSYYYLNEIIGGWINNV